MKSLPVAAMSASDISLRACASCSRCSRVSLLGSVRDHHLPSADLPPAARRAAAYFAAARPSANWRAASGESFAASASLALSDAARAASDFAAAPAEVAALADLPATGEEERVE